MYNEFMDAIQKQIRIMAVFQAKRLMFAGMSKEAACADANITVAQYNYWTEQLPDDMQGLRDLILEVEKEELAQLVAVRRVGINELMTQLLEKIQNGAYIHDPNKFMELMTMFQDRIADLKEELQAGGAQNETEAQAFLMKGPELAPGESRLASRAQQINIKAKGDGSIDVTLPVETETIDAEFSEDQ